MNIRHIIDCFSQKGWTWQRMFCNFYLLEHNLYGIKSKIDIVPAMLVRCCRNVDDLQEMWKLAEYLDSTEQEILQLIGTYRYCRSIPWQYDFVETVEKRAGIPIRQTLNLDAITDAYCIASYSDDVDLPALVRQLDEQYRLLYASVAQKQNVLKRNFSLVLDSLKHYRKAENAAGMNFRELVEEYLPACGLPAIVQALQQATTADIKITPEERAALGFAYYSPYFWDELELECGRIPNSTVFACVEGRLRDERAYRLHLEQQRWQKHDEDEEDEITDALEETHNAVYVDPQERCLIDTHYGDIMYANVYIERMPEDFLNNSLPDFIRYHKGFLYTIEFVDDIKQLDVAQKLIMRLNDVNRKMIQLEREQMTSGNSDWSQDRRQKYEKLNEERASCYYVCD